LIIYVIVELPEKVDLKRTVPDSVDVSLE